MNDKKFAQRSLTEKIDSLRINGWTRTCGADVWINSSNPNSKRLLVQVILSDGRVGECQIDRTSEKLIWD